MGVQENPSTLFNILQCIRILYLDTTQEISNKYMINLQIRNFSQL